MSVEIEIQWNPISESGQGSAQPSGYQSFINKDIQTATFLLPKKLPLFKNPLQNNIMFNAFNVTDTQGT
jgi:hypothetical protein